MKILQLCLLSLFFSIHLFGQMPDLTCECAHFSTPFQQNFEEFFIPKQIKKAGFKKVTITNYVYDTLIDESKKAFKIGGKKIKSYTFDDNGYVSSKTDHQYGDRTNSYKRDGNNRIVQALNDVYPSMAVFDYTYEDTDDENKVKFKMRVKGAIVPDSSANYNTITKDKQGRTIKKEHYYNSYNSKTGSETTYEYDDTNYIGIVKTTSTYSPETRIDTVLYNSNWQPVEYNHWSPIENFKPQILYKYDDKGQTVYMKYKDFASECEDGGSYEILYEYDDNQILKKVVYFYGDTFCTMYYKYE